MEPRRYCPVSAEHLGRRYPCHQSSMRQHRHETVIDGVRHSWSDDDPRLAAGDPMPPSWPEQQRRRRALRSVA